MKLNKEVFVSDRLRITNFVNLEPQCAEKMRLVFFSEVILVGGTYHLVLQNGITAGSSKEAD